MTEPEPKAKPKAGWYHDTKNPGILRRWDGAAWTEDRKPEAPAAEPPKKSVASPFWFCVGLGVAGFFLLLNLSTSTNGHDCGTVMNPTSYSGRSAAEIDPTGSLGEYGSTATAASAASAEEQNAACKSSRDSRQNFAALAGIVLFAVSMGAVRLIRS